MIVRLVLLFVVLILCVELRTSVANEPEPSALQALEFNEDVKHIHALAESKDLKGLDEFLAALKAKWARKDPVLYGELVVEGTAELCGTDFGDESQYDLEHKYAIDTLELADRLPVELETRLVSHVTARLWSPTGPKGEVWAKQRTRDMTFWFHTWKRIKDTIDPNWDQERDAPRPAAPPKSVEGWATGISPKAIKDPVERTRYEKVAQWIEQIVARRLDQEFSPMAEGWIIKAYSAPPENETELKVFLNKYDVHPEAQQRILDRVKTNLAAKNDREKKE